METINPTAKRFIDSLAKGIADLTIGVVADSIAEYNRKQAEERQAKKKACIELIEKAITSGKRIRKQALFDIMPSLAYCASRTDIAMYLGITIHTFNAGVKRWYHIF